MDVNLSFEDRKKIRREEMLKNKTNIIVGPSILPYCRVSTTQQVKEGHSIEVQQKKILEYIQLNNIQGNISEPFVDAGISGKNMSDRPEFQRMKSIMKKGDIIISYSLSRLGRNTKDVIDFSYELKEKGVNLVVLDHKIDTTTPYGEFFFALIAALSQLERDLTSERTRAVINQRKDEGYCISRPRYGYTVDKETKKLVPLPEEQKVIETIAIWIEDDPKIKTAEITRRLQGLFDAGQISMRNARAVYPAAVKNIINNNGLRENVNK